MKPLLFSLLLLFSSFSLAAQKQAAIASAHPLATQAGFEILDQGGNAFDAAIAVTAALAVVEPTGSGLGGGGFWLLHRAKDQYQTMIDGREIAPGEAHKNMYLGDNGEFDPLLSLNAPLAAGIPGVPAGLAHLAEHYGKLPLSISLAPAIRYAEQGFEVTPHYQQLAQLREKVLNQYPSTATIFLDNHKVPELGHKIIQADLANTLKSIASQGKAGFYQGDIANKLVNAVQKHGGIWTVDDLARYHIKERPPITGDYHGYRITSTNLPSSGGILLMLILNQLANFDLTQATTDQKRHWIIEAMRRSYYERSRYLGDADFVAIPSQLTSKTYAKTISADIDNHQASQSQQLGQTRQLGEDTTHFSVIDSDGNRVAATLSINYPFGSGFVAEGTGVLLNDEMDDFSAQPGKPNVYGLVGNQANAIAPYKRPLSSMSPSFIENDEKLMITGTPGGSRIISMVLLSMLDFIDGKTAEQIVSAPRFHHQYLPDAVQVENTGFTEQALSALQERGHQIKPLNRQYGNMQTIIVDKRTGDISAASDPRGEGLSLVK